MKSVVVDGEEVTVHLSEHVRTDEVMRILAVEGFTPGMTATEATRLHGNPTTIVRQDGETRFGYVVNGRSVEVVEVESVSSATNRPIRRYYLRYPIPDSTDWLAPAIQRVVQEAREARIVTVTSAVAGDPNLLLEVKDGRVLSVTVIHTSRRG